MALSGNNENCWLNAAILLLQKVVTTQVGEKARFEKT
jgi:hypothetical protein